jgi:PleD family two-component response regulator
MQKPILLVNGGATIRAANRSVLEHAGYAVVEARNVDEAVATARRRPLRVIVVEPGADVHMPLRLARRLRRMARTRFLPIIVLGNDQTTNDAAALEALEALDCLTSLREPCPPAQLLEEVQYAMLHAPGPCVCRVHPAF